MVEESCRIQLSYSEDGFVHSDFTLCEACGYSLISLKPDKFVEVAHTF